MDDLSGTVWKKLLWKDLSKEDVSYIAKKCSETEDYVKGIVMVNKKADQLVEGKEWTKEGI